MRLRRTLAKTLSATLALLVGTAPISASAFTLQSVQLNTVNLSTSSIPTSQVSTGTTQTTAALAQTRTMADSALHAVSFPGKVVTPSMGAAPPARPGVIPRFVPLTSGQIAQMHSLIAQYNIHQAAPGIASALLDMNQPHMADPHAMATGARSVQNIALKTVSTKQSLAVTRSTMSVNLTISTTGMVPWWTYMSKNIPGVGSYAINVTTGNLLVQANDMTVPHRDIGFDFTRTYNSQSKHNASNTDGSGQGIYGDGWTNTIDRHLAVNNSGGISFYDATGARWDFTSNGNGGWNAPTGLHTSIAWDGASGYFMYYPSGQVDYYWSPFSNQLAANQAAYLGRLNQVIGRDHNNFITFEYAFNNNDASSINNINEITEVAEDGTSAYLYFGVFSGKPELQYLIRPDGTTVGYTYANTSWSNAAGTNLWLIQKPGNSSYSPVSETYAYNTPNYAQMSDAASPRWAASSGNDGVNLHYGYDSSTRVTTVTPYTDLNITPSDGTNTPLQASYSQGIVMGNLIQLTYAQQATPSANGLTQYADADGHQQQWAMDILGRVNGYQVSTGTTTLTSHQYFDASNNLIASVDYSGNETDSAYDANGNLIAKAAPSVTTSAGTFRPTQLFSYDIYSNLLASCDPVWVHSQGLDWTSGFASSDALCPRQTGTTQYFYNWAGGSPSYEPFGHLSDVYTPTGYHTSYGYTATGSSDQGAPIAIDGATFTQNDGSIFASAVNYTYTVDGQVASVTNPYGTSSYTYDAVGRLLSAKDADGVVAVTNAYNPDGSVLETQSALQKSHSVGTTYTYDADGNVLTVTHHYNSTAAVTKNWYDGLDRLVETQMPTDTNDGVSYPPENRQIYDISLGSSVSFNGVSAAANGTGSLSTTYHAHGNLFKKQRYNGNSWADVNGYAYDALDRVVNAIKPIPGAGFGTTLNSYDQSASSLGQLGIVTHPMGDQLVYSYDAMGRVQSVTPNAPTGVAAAGSVSYQYDPDGKLASATSSTMGKEAFVYDANGNLTEHDEAPTYSGTADVPSSVAPLAPGKIFYSYYPNGTRSTLGVQNSYFTQNNLFAYSYRNDGKLQKLNVSAFGNTYSFGATYTAAGRLQTRTNPFEQSVTGATYDANGNLATFPTSNGTFNGFTYDNENEYTGFTYAPDNTKEQSITNTALPAGSVFSYTSSYSTRGELLSMNNTAYPAGSSSGASYAPQPVMNKSYAGALINLWPSNTPPSNLTALDQRVGLFTTNLRYNTDGQRSQVVSVPEVINSNGTNNDTNYKYDAYGNLATIVGTSQSCTSAPAADPATSFNYVYSPTNQIVSDSIIWTDSCSNSRSAGTFPYSLTWDGNSPLYALASSNGTKAALIFVGNAAIIGYNVTTHSVYDVTAYNRDFLGNAFAEVNQTGHTSVLVHTPGLTCLDSNDLVALNEKAAATSWTWSSDQCRTATDYNAKFGTIYGGSLWDGLLELHGGRQVDTRGASESFLESDPTADGQSDPIKSLPYAYANNNAMEYNDPTGFSGSPISFNLNFGVGPQGAASQQTASPVAGTWFQQVSSAGDFQPVNGPEDISNEYASATLYHWLYSPALDIPNPGGPSNTYVHIGGSFAAVTPVGVVGGEGSTFIPNTRGVPIVKSAGADYGLAPGAGGFATTGWAYNWWPPFSPMSSAQLDNYLTGFSFGAMAGVGGILGIGFNLNGFNYEMGSGSPQASGGVTYGFH